MRCFLLLTLVGGLLAPDEPSKSYVNRDLMTVVTPARPSVGSEYARARPLVSLNGKGVICAETPAEIMQAPCVIGRSGPPD